MGETTKIVRITCLLLLAIAVLPQKSQGINCMVCENARTYEECDQKGQIMRCDKTQDSCQTETRTFGSKEKRYTVIRKSCKAGRACNRNYAQNPAIAWSPTQCNEVLTNSVCRCCCATNACNVGKSKCFGGCPYVHKAPEHGSYSCTSGTGLGSVCTFSCDFGYVVQGSSESRCGQNKQWSSPTPRCRKVACDDVITRPVDGTFWCTRSNSVGSVCRFFCNDGLEMAGSRMTICKQGKRGARWSDEQPVCFQPPPPPIQNEPEFGMCTQSNLPEIDHSTVECDQELARVYEPGTKCRYTCQEGWQPTGEMVTTCSGVEDSHYWSEVESICQPYCRPRAVTLEHGSVSCEGEGTKEQCTFECNYDGYVLEGEATVRCDKDVNGTARWSSEFPVCKQELTCDVLDHLEHGSVQCLNSLYNAGTTCNFTCDTNYHLVGYDSVECLTERNGKDEFVTWTHETPTCELVMCPVQLLPHGSVNCTNGTHIGSECSFTCEDNYQLMPETYCKNKCMPDGKYDSYPACCEPICPPMVPGNLLILIEASEEMDMKDWNGFVSIVVDLLSNLVLSDESLHVAVLPFSDGLKHSHFINFTSDHEALVRQLTHMNFRDVKGDSALHLALQNVPDYFHNLAPRVGGSEDQLASVLVLTTRKMENSEENNLIKEAADSLSNHFEIMAVGYDDKGGDIDTVLNYIAGEGSFAKLKRGRCVSLWTDQVLELMKKRLCRQRACLHRNHDHPPGVTLIPV